MAARKPEQKLRDYWKALVVPFVSDDLTWIETPSTSGVPDCSLCTDGRESWVECKVTVAPKRPDTPLDLRHFTVEQENWLYKRGVHGSPVYLLLRVEGREGPHHLLVHGSAVKALRGAPLAQAVELAKSHGYYWFGLDLSHDLARHRTSLRRCLTGEAIQRN